MQPAERNSVNGRIFRNEYGPDDLTEPYGLCQDDGSVGGEATWYGGG